MNIILFVNKDFEANLAYNLLKEELIKHRVKVYYSESVGKKKSKPKELLEVEYFEKAFFYTKLVDTLRSENIPVDFEFFNEDFNTFPLSKCTDVNAPSFIEEVALFEPDLFISIRFGKIFRDEIIQVPKKGILNLHSAILPHYRGIMGTLHNLREDKKQYGCTLHYISSSEIDTGEIIDIAKRDIEKDRSLLWHVVQLYPMGCALIQNSIKALGHVEKLPYTNQDMTEGSYFSVPIAEDFEQLTSQGIDVFKLDDYIELLEEFVSKDIGEIVKSHLN